MFLKLNTFSPLAAFAMVATATLVLWPVQKTASMPIFVVLGAISSAVALILYPAIGRVKNAVFNLFVLFVYTLMIESFIMLAVKTLDITARAWKDSRVELEYELWIIVYGTVIMGCLIVCVKFIVECAVSLVVNAVKVVLFIWECIPKFYRRLFWFYLACCMIYVLEAENRTHVITWERIGRNLEALLEKHKIT